MEAQHQPPTRENSVVLIVEDEVFVRLMAVDIVEDAGYATVEAEDAERAMALLEDRTDIGLVFTDIKMPGDFDGLALAERVRERWPRLPIVITSGHLGRSDPSMPASIPFLQKPYRAGALVEELDRLLR